MGKRTELLDENLEFLKKKGIEKDGHKGRGEKKKEYGNVVRGLDKIRWKEKEVLKKIKAVSQK